MACATESGCDPKKKELKCVQFYGSTTMIRKGQIAGIGSGEIQMQVKFVSNLFGIAA